VDGEKINSVQEIGITGFAIAVFATIVFANYPTQGQAWELPLTE
jgi:hypothetical protein